MQIPWGRGEKPYGDPSRGYLTCQSVGKSLLYLDYIQIKINTFSSSSEESEQRGYHDLLCGVVSALRNPTAHSPADEEFIRERFGNRRTALKFRCLLSLLLEKLDKRIVPR